jgi:glycosyltransferase involved in cell wall biosynthesis
MPSEDVGFRRLQDDGYLMNATIVVPAYNEEKNIEKVLRKISSVGRYEIIVVDDGSTDSTAEIAENYARVIKLKKNTGKGHACRTGARAAKYQDIVFIDSDGQLDPKYIPKFLEELKNCGIVVGSRRTNEMPIQRRLSNSFARWIAKKITRYDLGDYLCGLRAIKKRDFLRLKLEKNRYEFESEMIIKAARNGLSAKSVPVGVTYESYRGMPIIHSVKVAFYLLSESVKNGK